MIRRIPPGALSWCEAALVAASCAASAFVGEILTSTVKPVDFQVYRIGAQTAFAGGDVYTHWLRGLDIAPTGLPFTYPPFAALFLWPTTWFSPAVAAFLWSLLATACLAASLHLVRPAWADEPSPRLAGFGRWPLALSGLVLVLALSDVVNQHLAYGQINLLLMAMCLFDVARRDDTWLGRWLPRGTLIGVAAAVKLVPMFFVALFLLTRQWRLAAWTIAGAVAATAAGFAAFPEMSARFFRSTFWGLSDSVAFAPEMFASPGNASVQGAVAFLGGPHWLGTALAAAVGAAGLWCARQTFLRAGLLAAMVSAGVVATVITPASWIHRAVFFIPAVLILWWNGDRGQRRAGLLLGAALFCWCPSLANVLGGTGLPALAPLAFVLRFAQQAAELVAVVLLARLPGMARWTGEQPEPDPPTPARCDGGGRGRGCGENRVGGRANPAAAV
ncbi:MAG: glycosyltransferase 87 family protein [Segniliparus sp.]|uniref:glycosyltransferase 87 family protein n=1 Tax=Segniliparus sp. TaxID=2804064 RepID=UPI003F3F5FB5